MSRGPIHCLSHPQSQPPPPSSRSPDSSTTRTAGSSAIGGSCSIWWNPCGNQLFGSHGSCCALQSWVLLCSSYEPPLFP
jgi:hypothetical protein